MQGDSGGVCMLVALENLYVSKAASKWLCSRRLNGKAAMQGLSTHTFLAIYG